MQFWPSTVDREEEYLGRKGHPTVNHRATDLGKFGCKVHCVNHCHKNVETSQIVKYTLVLLPSKSWNASWDPAGDEKKKKRLLRHFRHQHWQGTRSYECNLRVLQEFRLSVPLKWGGTCYQPPALAFNSMWRTSGTLSPGLQGRRCVPYLNNPSRDSNILGVRLTRTLGLAKMRSTPSGVMDRVVLCAMLVSANRVPFVLVSERFHAGGLEPVWALMMRAIEWGVNECHLYSICRRHTIARCHMAPIVSLMASIPAIFTVPCHQSSYWIKFKPLKGVKSTKFAWVGKRKEFWQIVALLNDACCLSTGFQFLWQWLSLQRRESARIVLLYFASKIIGAWPCVWFSFIFTLPSSPWGLHVLLDCTERQSFISIWQKFVWL